MATNNPRRPRKPWVTPAIQDRFVRASFPSFTGSLGPGRATWRGKLQPQVSSPVYDVEIRYRHKFMPRVFIKKPVLLENAPHLYSNEDDCLCLYWPKEWRWSAEQLIADTILPWTALWLFYYELWLDTGKWLGPSSHD